MDHPHETQDVVFKNLVEKARYTEWGRKYDYSSIKSAGDFSRRVMVQDYETIKPWIIRLRHGEKNLLWPGEIRWFAKSSGTTSDKSKFIPVSDEALRECHYRGGMDIFTFYCRDYPQTNIFTGKSLSIGGSHQVNQFSHRSRYGDISAVLIQNMPWWAERSRVPSRAIALMDEWEEKLEKMAGAAIRENITSIAGVPSWTLVLLKKILDRTGTKNISDVWPGIELFIHGAVSFIPYRDQYRMIMPEGIRYLETYNASEGMFAVQDQPSSDEMLMLLDHGVYYEFIPAGEAESENPETVQLSDVKKNINYAIVISTNAGLWRYRIGDTIRFTSLNPYRIQVSGRTKHFINAFGEEVIVDNSDHAIADACMKTGAIVKEYTAAPVYMMQNESGAHEWLIEFEKSPGDLEKFIDYLDEALKHVNSDYEAKRYKDLALKRPVVHPVAEGTFHRWFKEKGKLGGQHKVPRLSNDRKIIEEILSKVC